MLALNIAHFPKNLASESHRAFGASPEARPLFWRSTLRNKRLTAPRTLEAFAVHALEFFRLNSRTAVWTNGNQGRRNLFKIEFATGSHSAIEGRFRIYDLRSLVGVEKFTKISSW
jgi:hypothetical protein